MSDIIHLLPDHIANQIAAGEVIQRPASVVKELLENAIDAGAVNITVNIKDAGRTLIQIIDDGKGMSETDARMAFERHATSKISSVNDLFALNTMGFRGEALASIAAVAQVELITRTKDNEVGTFLSVSGSVLDSVVPKACNTGSIFSVNNIFYNVPARRKFLKSNDVEFRHILTEFERVVLVNPDIAFTLKHNESVVFNLAVCGLKQRIVDVFGKGMNQKLLSLEAATSLVDVYGFVGRLDTVKKRNGLQYFFVNNRYMRHGYFHKAVMQAYEQLINTGETPDYFIYFKVDPSTIDVNIHPTKTEIKFENERPVWQIIYSAVREALAKSNSVPSIDFDLSEKIDIPVYNPVIGNEIKAEMPKIHLNSDYNPFRDFSDRRPAADDWKTLYEDFEKEKTIPTSPQIEENLFTEVSNLCFQYKSRYIVTTLKSGLVIIDQRRAHIRILYERYLSNIIRKSSASQKLLFPEIVEFTASEASMVASLLDEIRYLGFDLADLGGNSFAINAVPSDVSGGSTTGLVKDIIVAAMESRSTEAEKQSEKMALSLAKATAINAGKTLTSDEMDAIVGSLFALEANGLTPDGLPVLTIFTDEELMKRLEKTTFPK
ncbi:MAG: DNA mismatch repair endonuclease MutL [Tannerella sp.]|jgi:DNA mismatch repair protein MutL|nr:DNA mismatch repair endonuclease MutL [Tannerella sp.]